MSIFAISDLHLSLSTDKSMDIFPGWNDYVNRIKKNWNNIVKATDTVVIAGDISWAMKLEDSFADMQFLNSLSGTKIFIKGNHDLWWSTKKKVQDFFTKNDFSTLKILFNDSIIVDNVCICGTRGWFYDDVEAETNKIILREANRLKRSIEQALSYNMEPIVFLHYPPVYNGQECKEILDVLKDYNIKQCYYGHVHGTNAVKRVVTGIYKEINFTFISCDYTNFRPILVK